MRSVSECVLSGFSLKSTFDEELLPQTVRCFLLRAAASALTASNSLLNFFLINFLQFPINTHSSGCAESLEALHDQGEWNHLIF